MSVGQANPLSASHARSTNLIIPPFQQVVLKISGRCNLACSYCYMSAAAGRRERPSRGRMSWLTIDQVAHRILEHVSDHELSSLNLVLHGGEPLLVGGERIARYVHHVRRVVGEAATLRFSVQTNGTLLRPRVLELLRTLDVSVGVSVDGRTSAHDRHRKYRTGRGSYADVAHGLRILGSERYRPLFSGVLAVIDVRNDPIETYEGLLEFAPPMMDFLLPHGDWEKPPPGAGADAPYGRWLAAVFDRWYAPATRETQVRFFGEIMSLLLGGGSRLEGIGTSPSGFVVIETDGSIEASDLPSGVSSSFERSDLTVATDPLAAAAQLPLQVVQRGGLRSLAAPCQSCVLGPICGGGLYTHRYSHPTGNLNPSVYCQDLSYLIGHIHHRMAADLPALKAGTAPKTGPAVKAGSCR